MALRPQQSTTRSPHKPHTERRSQQASEPLEQIPPGGAAPAERLLRHGLGRASRPLGPRADPTCRRASGSRGPTTAGGHTALTKGARGAPGTGITAPPGPPETRCARRPGQGWGTRQIRLVHRNKCREADEMRTQRSMSHVKKKQKTKKTGENSRKRTQ